MEKHVEEQLEASEISAILEEITVEELTQREEYAACLTVK